MHFCTDDVWVNEHGLDYLEKKRNMKSGDQLGVSLQEGEHFMDG